jgi:hypothetical protein
LLLTIGDCGGAQSKTLKKARKHRVQTSSSVVVVVVALGIIAF